MKRNRIIWLVAIILVVVALGTTMNYNNKNEEKAAVVTPTPTLTPTPTPEDSSNSSAQEPIMAPDFTLKDLNGNAVSLSSLKGKKVYINFWATWCGYCKEEMPDLQKISDEYKDKNLVVLAVNVGESQALAAKYVKDNQYNFQVVLDLDSQVAGSIYGVSGYPTSIFVNTDGTVSGGVEGMMSYEAMKTQVDKLK